MGRARSNHRQASRTDLRHYEQPQPRQSRRQRVELKSLWASSCLRSPNTSYSAIPSLLRCRAEPVVSAPDLTGARRPQSGFLNEDVDALCPTPQARGKDSIGALGNLHPLTRYLKYAESCGRPSLYFPYIPKISGFCCSCIAFTGSRNRRQHCYLHSDRSTHAAIVAG